MSEMRRIFCCLAVVSVLLATDPLIANAAAQRRYRRQGDEPTTGPATTWKLDSLFPTAAVSMATSSAGNMSANATSSPTTTTNQAVSAVPTSSPQPTTTTPSTTNATMSATSITQIATSPAGTTRSLTTSSNATNISTASSFNTTSPTTAAANPSPSNSTSSVNHTTPTTRLPATFSSSGYGPLTRSTSQTAAQTTALSMSMTAANSSVVSAVTSPQNHNATGTSTAVTISVNSTQAPSNSLATQPGFIALYAVAGVWVLVIVGACVARRKLGRAEQSGAEGRHDSETGLLSSAEFKSPGTRLHDKWNGNPVYNKNASLPRSTEVNDGGYIQELNESDDSDHEPNGKQDTGSINTESTHPDARSNTESLPRGLGGFTRSFRPPGTLEIGGLSAGSTPGGTWGRDRTLRSDEEGREGGDEEEFSGKEDTGLRRFIFSRSATLDGANKQSDSRESQKRRKFANLRSRSTTTSPMHEMAEEGKVPPPLPGEGSAFAMGDIRGSGRRRSGHFTLLPQAVAPALPMGAAPPPPPIPEGGFQPANIPSPLATTALTASSESSLDTIISERISPTGEMTTMPRHKRAPSVTSSGTATLSRMDSIRANDKLPLPDEDGVIEVDEDGNEISQTVYELVGQNLPDAFEDDIYLAPADDSVIRYDILKAKKSAVSEQSAASPEGARKTSQRRSARNIRKTPTQAKTSSSSLKRMTITQQWKEREAAMTTTLPRLPYSRPAPQQDSSDKASQRSHSVPSTLKPSANAAPLLVSAVLPEDVSQSTLTRLDESEEEPPVSSLVVLSGMNMTSRVRMLELSSPEEVPSEGKLSDDTFGVAQRRVLSALDDILREEGGVSSVGDLHRNASSGILSGSSADNILEGVPESPTKRKIGRAEQGYGAANTSSTNNKSLGTEQKAPSPTKSRAVSAPQFPTSIRMNPVSLFSPTTNEQAFRAAQLELKRSQTHARRTDFSKMDAEDYHLRVASPLLGKLTPVFY